VGTASSLRYLNGVGLERIHDHDVGLADLARERLDVEPADSSMVSLRLESDFDPSRLDGLRTAYRAGRLRAGFHLYNTEDDVDRLVAAVRG
jgi:selenocysteine lyase/cysteine desulfurase